MLTNFWSSQEQQAQPHPQATPTDSWYPPSVSLPSSSRPGPTDQTNSLLNIAPAEAAGIMAMLKDRSVDELRKLLSDKHVYQNLLLSLEPVRTQNKVGDELRNETLQIAKENLEKEPCITELRNQCSIIRTSELASVQEKLHDLERKTKDILKYYSSSYLLSRLQEAMDKTEEESEALHRQFLDGELEVTAFVQKYKKMRTTYHKRALTDLAMKTSVTG